MARRKLPTSYDLFVWFIRTEPDCATFLVRLGAAEPGMEGSYGTPLVESRQARTAASVPIRCARFCARSMCSEDDFGWGWVDSQSDSQWGGFGWISGHGVDDQRRISHGKGKGGTPQISTASLPDIVFMLLFFFMVTTVMREVSLKVRVLPPEATEVKKLEKKSLVSYIYIGPPIKALVEAYGTEPRIQLNDAYATISDLSEFIVAEREARDEKEVPFMTTSLKVDKETKMGIITDVKQELRELNALKINYSTKKGMKKALN